LKGAVDENARRIALEISANHDGEIIAWWPADWGGAVTQ
jgi:hypothetical protein